MRPLPVILVVEDDEVEAELLNRAFAKYKMPYTLFVAADGLVALQMLRGEEGYSPLPWPYLILLDLNMPRLSGLAFLEILRRDPILHPSLVCVMTTSDAQRDQSAAFYHHVAAYFIKSQLSADLADLMTFLHQYCSLTQFPTQEIEGNISLPTE